jgi:hypothetical protein
MCGGMADSLPHLCATQSISSITSCSSTAGSGRQQEVNIQSFLPVQVHVNWVIGSSHNARDLPQALSNAHPSSLSGQQLDREHEWSGANGCECIHTGIVALHPPASLSVVKPQHPSRAKAITQPLALLRHTVASGQRETLAGFGTLGTRAFTAAVVL